MTYKLSDATLEHGGDAPPQILIHKNSIFSILNPSKCSCSYHSKIFITDSIANKTNPSSYEKMEALSSYNTFQDLNHYDSYLSNCLCQYHSSFTGMQNNDDNNGKNKKKIVHVKDAVQNIAPFSNSAEDLSNGLEQEILVLKKKKLKGILV